MGRKPVLFVSQSRARFAEIDPYGHVSTQHYIGHFIDHRFHCMREQLGLDLRAVGKLPIAFVTTKMTVNFVRSLVADQEYRIESSVVEFAERTCSVHCEMTVAKGDKRLLISTCDFEFACLDRATGQTVPWPPDVEAMFYE